MGAGLAWLSAPALATTLGVLMTPPVASTRLLHDGIEDRVRARPGVSAVFAYAPEGAGQQQIAQAVQFIDRKVDALVLMPVDAAATAEIVRLAQAADVPLVCVGDGPPEDWLSGRIAVVLPDERVAGRLQMRKLAQTLNGTGRIAILEGHPGHSRSHLRTLGVREVAAQYPGLTIVRQATADWDRRTAAALVSAWLAAGAGIDAIVANNDAMALGAADAVAAAALPPGRILIAGVDATPDGLRAVQDRRMAVTVFTDAGLLGRRAVDDALKLVRGEPVQQYDWVPFELITERMVTRHFAE
jgi:ABC-type sugar transport system substrate-binding protein